jgi:large subunit ribosomal protein L15
MLRLNEIKAQPGSVTARKRLGRGQGSGLGGTSGKGHKGQLARAGGRVHPGFEGGQTPLYRRLPKRGFKNSGARTQAVVNLVDLEVLLPASVKEVNLSSLLDAGLIKGEFDRLAVLGTGTISKSLTIKAHKISASAKEKIEKAGGKVEMIAIPGAAPRPKKTKKK